ncbi:ABC transporter permease [Halorussus salilacus]|uniref:ABC transporter permease n=1 Tax=Halorussus salilacus TaxID=2953750 RepID=UPI00209E8C0D|nr:ABC transporter permease [Halorussus salilacus]USZ66794.1 ABC transporter permease [Halorussus salilacus]
MSRVNDDEDATIIERIQENPGPATRWLAGALALFALEAGAVVNFVTGLFGSPVDIPTLLSRDVIPNNGYQTPSGVWEETFMGLSAGQAWGVRVFLVYLYAFIVVWWCWRGYFVFRKHYRYADWTPRDDMIDRLRGHRWGQFGAIIVFMFVVMAVFAPALGPTTVERTISDPYSYHVEYYEDGELENVTVGQANLGARSQGTSDRNVGPMEYDDFGRFHPFGTIPSGKDLFTFMAAGARVSLFIGLVSIGLSGFIAASFALLTAYYKGLVDLAVVITGDSIMSLPRLLFVMLLSVVLGGSWISKIYNGGFLLALIFAGTGWPILWRAVRGPAFQVAEQEWIDAAKSFGQKPRVTMQKHMAPYIVGYLLVYASMSLGGIIVGVAGLSFLGLGISPPTPEWGRAIDMGQSYVTTASWHISFIPGVMIVLVVTAFNALGDGIRDAIDPQSEGASDSGTEAAAGTGGGA